MYIWVWLTGGIGILFLIMSVLFLMRDYHLAIKYKYKPVRYLIPNWGLIILTVIWLVLAILLHNAIQMQMIG
jgi:hypothetical protein